MSRPSQSIKFKSFWFLEIEIHKINKKIRSARADRDPYRRSNKVKEIEERIIILKRQAPLGSVGEFLLLFAVYGVGRQWIPNVIWRLAFAIALSLVFQAIFSILAKRRLKKLQQENWNLHDPTSIPYIVDQLPSFWKVSNGKHEAIEAVIQSFQILLADLQTVNLSEHLNDARIATLVRYCREVLKQPNLTDNETALVKDLLARLVDITNPLDQRMMMV